MEWLAMERWSPYLAGAGIGLLCCLTFLFLDKGLGVTTAFARTSGMIERLLRGRRALERPYYRKFAPEVDWEWMLVLGVVIGAFLSATLSGRFHARWIPGMWEMRFGPSIFPRLAASVSGGILMGFGARWAGGCTSGHGISGTLQLAVSSWIATTCFFIGGILTAFLIYSWGITGMFDEIRESRALRLRMGLIFGVIFGFLLQKGGVTEYDVLLGQLLLTDFTVVKVMVAAVITGMVGIEILRSAGLVTLHPKTGSLGSTIPGGLLFGVGFALLGYCPGTMAGAVGEGRLDALLGGVTGVLLGSWLYAVAYPALERSVLAKGDFGELTFPALFGTKPRTIVVPVAIGLIVVLAFLERAGM